MRIRHFLKGAAVGLAALSLTACATGLNTKVTRYQPASIPAGQSFYVVPTQGTPSPQFYRFASMLAQQLEARGYRPAGAPQLADMLVRVNYGVDQGTVEQTRDPFVSPFGYTYGRYGDPFSGYPGIYYGRPYWSRWSAFPYYYGWNDPYWSYGPGYGYGSFGRGFDSYTIYKSFLDMDIVQRTSNAPLFEGHAKARSSTDELDALVPDLIDAMFTGFPGQNGETVRITVPAKPRKG